MSFLIWLVRDTAKDMFRDLNTGVLLCIGPFLLMLHMAAVMLLMCRRYEVI